MRRKGDEGGKPGQEQQGEEGTPVGKLKWECSAGGTQGVRARTGPTQLLWVGKHHQLQQQFLHRQVYAQQIHCCSKNQGYPNQLLILTTVLIYTIHGVSKLYGLLALGRRF